MCCVNSAQHISRLYTDILDQVSKAALLYLSLLLCSSVHSSSLFFSKRGNRLRSLYSCTTVQLPDLREMFSVTWCWKEKDLLWQFKQEVILVAEYYFGGGGGLIHTDTSPLLIEQTRHFEEESEEELT